MKKKYVIIGAAAAGMGVVNTLTRLDPDSEIMCISKEKELPYNKCFLADFLGQTKTKKQLSIIRERLLQNNNVSFLLGKTVVSLNRTKKIIILDDSHIINYDKLFIGTGCSPSIPDIKGITIDGVFMFQTLHDANAIITYIKKNKVKKAVVIGAGLSGLECADALLSWDVQPVVVEMQKQVLPTQIDETGAHIIQKNMRDYAVLFYKNKQVVEVLKDDKKITGVRLSDNAIIETDMIVCATGLMPNTQLAKDAEIMLNQHYIVVDTTMQTNDADIFAGGDCVLVNNFITGEVVPSCMWPDAMQQGMIAAHNMVGQRKTYPGAILITSSSFFGAKFAACGVFDKKENYDTKTSQSDEYYQKLLLKKNILHGFVLIGNTQKLGQLRKALLTKQPL